MSLTSDFNKNYKDYIDKAMEINLAVGRKSNTGVLDANSIICMCQAEKDLHMPELLKKFLSIYEKALVSTKVLQKETESKGVSIKIFYNMPNIDVVDIVNQDITCNTDNGSRTFPIPSNYNNHCKGEFNSKSGILSASYDSIKNEGDESEHTLYTPHTQKHLGDGEVLYLATTNKKNGSYVITEERDKENKKSLEDALKINNIPYYSVIDILPTMTSKGLVKEEEMLKIAQYLSCPNLTNRLIPNEILIEAVNKIKHKDFETSL